MPEPTIVKLKNKNHLVLTQLSKDGVPTVYFYKLENLDDSMPTYKIEGAELLIDCKSN